MVEVYIKPGLPVIADPSWTLLRPDTSENPLFVIPAKAGIQSMQKLDPDFRRDDIFRSHPLFPPQDNENPLQNNAGAELAVGVALVSVALLALVLGQPHLSVFVLLAGGTIFSSGCSPGKSICFTDPDECDALDKVCETRGTGLLTNLTEESKLMERWQKENKISSNTAVGSNVTWNLEKGGLQFWAFDKSAGESALLFHPVDNPSVPSTATLFDIHPEINQTLWIPGGEIFAKNRDTLFHIDPQNHLVTLPRPSETYNEFFRLFYDPLWHGVHTLFANLKAEKEGYRWVQYRKNREDWQIHLSIPIPLTWSHDFELRSLALSHSGDLWLYGAKEKNLFLYRLSLVPGPDGMRLEVIPYPQILERLKDFYKATTEDFTVELMGVHPSDNRLLFKITRTMGFTNFSEGRAGFTAIHPENLDDIEEVITFANLADYVGLPCNAESLLNLYFEDIGKAEKRLDEFKQAVDVQRLYPADQSHMVGTTPKGKIFQLTFYDNPLR